MAATRKMTLRSKITWLVLLNIFVMLFMMLSAVLYLVVEDEFRDKGKQALAMSRVVAGTPEIVNAFSSDKPSAIIQPIAERLRKASGADLIIVANMNQIRYSHPDPEKIGLRMVGEDNELVLSGQESITRAKGTLGLSIRGKTPVFDKDNRQIGIVSTGFLAEKVWGNLRSYFVKIATLGMIALMFGFIGARMLSGHVKKQLFDMEPYEIAFATNEQAAILEAIREGIIAVNSTGQIVSCNREAKKMLGVENENVIGREVIEVFPATRMPEVLKSGIPQYDQPSIIGNTLAIVNRVPVILSGKVIGAVCTFRDKVHLDKIDQRLIDIGHYVDTLRSQRHEFMNKLHLISGLIQTSEFDMARTVIDQVNEEYQNAVQFYLARIRDAAIVGILVGKTHRAAELGIQLTVLPESTISESCPYREIVVTALGNTIDNAFESITHSETPKEKQPVVTILMQEDEGGVMVEVSDNGPGIDPAIREHIFEDQATTKGSGRGFGLSLVSRLVTNIGGTIGCESSPGNTVIRINLPKRGNDL
jgi:two-component system, CitB family, sensor kinase